MLDVAATEYLSFPSFLKATPSEEGGRRFVYLEASNEADDYQNEVVLAKALGESAQYFLRYGNLDLDHVTQIGPRRGIADYAAYEIGRPVEVKVGDHSAMVKGEIYQGDAPVAANANMFWDSQTKCVPPQRWYPSVGGAVLAKSAALDPKTKQSRTVIKKVRWTNIGFSKTPVNPAVPAVSTVPFGALAKSWGADGLDLRKALEAGYGTDVATLAGGAALREQSLDRGPQSYWDFRDRMSSDLKARRVRATPESIVSHAVQHYGLSKAEAAEWCERLLKDIHTARKGFH